MVQCGVPAVTKFIPAGIPQLSDPSPRYYRNIHTHTRRKPADSAGFPPIPSPCTPLCSASTWDNTKLDFISNKKTTNGRKRAKLRATFVYLGEKAEIFTIHLNSVNSVLRRRPAYNTASSSSFSDGAD